MYRWVNIVVGKDAYMTNLERHGSMYSCIVIYYTILSTSYCVNYSIMSYKDTISTTCTRAKYEIDKEIQSLLRGLSTQMPNGTFKLTPFIPLHSLVINLLSLVGSLPIILHNRVSLRFTIRVIGITSIVRMTGISGAEDRYVRRGRHGWRWGWGGHTGKTSIDDIGNRWWWGWMCFASLGLLAGICLVERRRSRHEARSSTWRCLWM